MPRANNNIKLYALAAMLCLCGCSNDQDAYDAAGEAARETALPISEETIPAVLSDEGDQVASGMNAFGVDLYRSLASEPGDLFFSPVSISTAFGLARAGANGATATELDKILRVPMGLKDANAAARNVQDSLSLNVQGRILAVNNALWIQKDLALRPEYVELIRKNYASGLNRVDYIADPSGSRNAINDWVLKQTHGRIRELVQPNQITKDTRVQLINTAYFKAAWLAEFTPEETKSEDFYRRDGSKNKRPLMHQTGWFSIVAGENMQAISLGYFGNETEMVVMLPDNKDGLAALERRLSPSWLGGWLTKLDNMQGSEVNLMLPKFKLEQRRELTEKLIGMGLKTAFTASADFSAMSAKQNIKLESVVHQVYLDVDEKGSDAAAASALEGAEASAGPPPPPPKIFRADHPFLFLIRDKRTGVILFMGRFTGE
jgi:serpin B